MLRSTEHNKIKILKNNEILAQNIIEARTKDTIFMSPALRCTLNEE